MSEDRGRRIQERAHQIWLRTGKPHGMDAEHWSQAEREIDAEQTAAPAAPKKHSPGQRRDDETPSAGEGRSEGAEARPPSKPKARKKS